MIQLKDLSLIEKAHNPNGKDSDYIIISNKLVFCIVLDDDGKILFMDYVNNYEAKSKPIERDRLYLLTTNEKLLGEYIRKLDPDAYEIYSEVDYFN